MAKKCLIVYPFFAHYRLHIIEEIFKSNLDWNFELVGDPITSGGIKGIDSNLAKKDIAKGGVNWTFTPLLYPFGRNNPLCWQSGLIKRLFRKDYDLVIMLGSIYYISYLFAVPILKVLKVPIVFWTHGFLGKDNYLISLIRHIFYSQANALLLYGNRAKKIMGKTNFYKNTSLYVINNSLDYSDLDLIKFDPDSKHRIISNIFSENGIPVVVASGRVNKSKRFDLLIEALNISVHKYRVLYNLLIIGDGPEVGNLKIMARKYKIEKYIHFSGEIYGKKVYEYLLSSDLCVIPGNVGLSAMHALSAGVPVISHNNFDIQMPEHEAIIEGVTGSFYKELSVEDLVSKIHTWILNPELLEKSKKNCLDIIKNKYSLSYQMKILEECLNEF